MKSFASRGLLPVIVTGAAGYIGAAGVYLLLCLRSLYMDAGMPPGVLEVIYVVVSLLGAVPIAVALLFSLMGWIALVILLVVSVILWTLSESLSKFGRPFHLASGVVLGAILSGAAFYIAVNLFRLGLQPVGLAYVGVLPGLILGVVGAIVTYVRKERTVGT